MGIYLNFAQPYSTQNAKIAIILVVLTTLGFVAHFKWFVIVTWNTVSWGQPMRYFEIISQCFGYGRKYQHETPISA